MLFVHCKTLRVIVFFTLYKFFGLTISSNKSGLFFKYKIIIIKKRILKKKKNHSEKCSQSVNNLTEFNFIDVFFCNISQNSLCVFQFQFISECKNVCLLAQKKKISFLFHKIRSRANLDYDLKRMCLVIYLNIEIRMFPKKNDIKYRNKTTTRSKARTIQRNQRKEEKKKKPTALTVNDVVYCILYMCSIHVKTIQLRNFHRLIV